MNEQEQNELLEAALRLAEICQSSYVETLESEKLDDIIATIEKHRPKPRLVEGWVNVYKGGRIGNTWDSETEAKINGGTENPPIRQAFIREVTDPPKWVKWTGTTVNDSATCGAVAELHNAEMERLIAAWKGRGDE
jgi:hypothetical protein